MAEAESVASTPTRLALAAPADEHENRCFTWNGVEFRVAKDLCRKLAKGTGACTLFDAIVTGYLAAMPMVARAILDELGQWEDHIDLPELSGTPEEIAAHLGPVTVWIVSRKWGTQLTYTEHQVDEDHLLDLEVTGAWESIDGVGLDG